MGKSHKKTEKNTSRNVSIDRNIFCYYDEKQVIGTARTVVPETSNYEEK